MNGEPARAQLAWEHSWPLLSSAFLLIAATASGQSGTPRNGPTVHGARIDGSAVIGGWIGSDDGKSVKLQTENAVDVIPMNGLMSLTFPQHVRKATHPRADELQTEAPSPSQECIFHLADGGHLTGVIAGPASVPDALSCRTGIGNVTIAFDRLAGVQFHPEGVSAKAAELYQASLTARLPGEDVLITHGAEEEVKKLRGRLVNVDAQGGTFIYGSRPRAFTWERLYGIVMAAGAGNGPEFPLTFELTDGSLFSGMMERADDTRGVLRSSIGKTVELPLMQLVRVQVASDRVVYLSSLNPLSRRQEGVLHSALPSMMDRSVSGDPLSIDGRGFDRGIGVHSYSELAFGIQGEYESFAVTIGIDDAARPRGNVVFRVLGDGEMLFDSGPVTGQDAPRDVVVKIANVSTLSLVVDYGEGLDLADYADWGGARLLKPVRTPNARPGTP